MFFAAHNFQMNLEELAKKPHPPIAVQSYFVRGYEEVQKRIRLAESLKLCAVGITVDNVRQVMLGDKPFPGRGPGVSITVREVEKVRKETSLPMFVKGIMCVEDAKLVVEAGADAIVVSNHGGRVVDYSRSPIESLPEIMKVVGHKTIVMVDSGFRRGTDALKALALGAKAIMIGRPIFWGAAAYGANGVAAVITKMTEELRRSMILCGVPSLDELSPEVLIKDPYFSIGPMPSQDPFPF